MTFPSPHADLLIAALHYLQASGGPENGPLIHTIAESAEVNPARQPLRARVKEAAGKLLSVTVVS